MMAVEPLVKTVMLEMVEDDRQSGIYRQEDSRMMLVRLYSYCQILLNYRLMP